MTSKPYTVSMEIAGPTAMWTRPDTGDSPASYVAPTFSAVRGIFSNILWGPAIDIVPVKVEVCSPILFHAYATNYGGPLRSPAQIKSNANYQMFATVLIDVCYRLYANIYPSAQKDKLPPKALAWDKKTTSPGHAYQSIFERRLRQGVCHQIPFLGLKEFTASYVGPFRPETRVLTEMPDIVIPSMLHEVFSGGSATEVNYTYRQNLVIHEGVLSYAGEEA